MAKQVQMTFRVESDLRTSFAEAAHREDRSVAQLLRDFMQSYVLHSGESVPAQLQLENPDLRDRGAAVSFARASVALEGFRLTPETEVLARRFANGEIDLNEFMQMPVPQKP